MRTTRWLAIVCGVCVLVLWSSLAMAWDKQEHYINSTGQPAWDLTKILWGDYTITDAIHAPFRNHVVVKWPSDAFPVFTVIHWYNPPVAVPVGGQVAACFNIAEKNRMIRVLGAWFTNETGLFIGWAGPNLSQGQRWVDYDMVGFQLKQEAALWSGLGYPLTTGDTAGAAITRAFTVNNAYCANIGRTPYTLDQLTPALYPSITWTALPSSFSLNSGAEYEWTLPSACVRADDEYILVRFTLVDGTYTTEDIAQFLPPVIPTLSWWGMIVLGVVLMATAAFVLYRTRRRETTSA